MIIGIDGGGTKTKFTLFTHDAKQLQSVTLGSCHVLQVSMQEMEDVLTSGVEAVLKGQDVNLEDVVICAGMGGYGQNQSIRTTIETVFKNCFPHCKVLLYNDAQIAVAGALGGNDGTVIISGTGSIALTLQDHEFKRVGGWGYILGDEGSSYWLGKKVLSIFTKQADGRMEKTPLYKEVRKYFHLNKDYELIRLSCDRLKDRGEVAKLARVCYDAAIKNDEIAISLFKEAASELALLVKALQPSSKKVSYVGGLFKASEFILPALSEELGSEYTIVEPMYAPEVGAYFLANNQ